MATRDRVLTRFVTASISFFFLAGFLADGVPDALLGFLKLQVSSGRLLSDFTVTGGVGAAFLNAAFVGLLGVVVLRLNSISFSGPTIAAIYTMMGFAMFGKTVLNVLPIIVGVSLAAVLVGKRPREYVLIAMFGTALGPVVSYIAFELGLPPVLALPASVLIGLLTGIILPSLAIAMLHLHQGYSLYNVGLTAGFIGLFVASISNAAGMDLSGFNYWGVEANAWLIAALPALCLFAIILAIRYYGKRAWKEFLSILSLPGRLPSDFCDLAGSGGALLNAGILGLLYVGFIFAIRVPFNGPVIGGLMTVVGFGLFGKHPKNVAPVFLGLLLGALIFGKSLTAPWLVLAFLFGTALAPLAGEFGLVVGMIAGFLHLVIVERTGTWHGGMNLYNNGFAGGLTATLLVSVIEWYKSNVER